MTTAIRFLSALVLALCSLSSLAQTDHEKIEIGSVLTAGIGIGTFAKPIPLPAGEWLVVSKRVDDVTLTRKDNRAMAGTPRVWLTLKNNRPADSLLFAMVISFTPDASNVNWGNGACENKNPKALVDDFGSKPDSLTYLCSMMYSQSGFKEKLEKVATATNKWWTKNLSELAAYAGEAPDKAMWIDVYGNQYRGRNVWFTFIFKREGDIAADPAYAQYVKDWAHAAGMSLGQVLDNSAAEFVLPKAYAAQP